MSSPTFSVTMIAAMIGGVLVLGLIGFFFITSALSGKPATPSTPPAERPPRAAALTEDEVIYLAIIESDGKIAAIRSYREATGLGLKEAKEAIDALEAGGKLPVIEKQQKPAGAKSDTAYLAIIEKDGKLAAIKAHREDTGKSLRESKDVVDKLAKEDRIPTSRMAAPSPQERANFEAQLCEMVATQGRERAVKAYADRYGVGAKEASDTLTQILRKAS